MFSYIEIDLYNNGISKMIKIYIATFANSPQSKYGRMVWLACQILYLSISLCYAFIRIIVYCCNTSLVTHLCSYAFTRKY